MSVAAPVSRLNLPQTLFAAPLACCITLLVMLRRNAGLVAALSHQPLRRKRVHVCWAL